MIPEPYVELAPAKVNLTLRVAGRRPDGFHELASLVAFGGPEAADIVTLAPAAQSSITVTGPFGATIAGANLVATTLEKVRAACPGLGSFAVTLDKRLPVAAGIGGGSADAAAVLRLLRRASPDLERVVDWSALALSLGADVPVCLASRTAFMTGTGEHLTPLPPLPVLPVVLINPLVPVPADKTAQVFRALEAAPLPERYAAPRPPAGFAGAGALLDYMVANPNDLTAAARSVVREIGGVIATLSATDGCRLARLSGGGPTCFGVYEDEIRACDAARLIAVLRPEWWVRATTLS